MYGEDGMDTMKVPFLNPKHIAFLDANRHVIENEEVDEKLQNDYEIERKIQKHKKSVNFDVRGNVTNENSNSDCHHRTDQVVGEETWRQYRTTKLFLTVHRRSGYQRWQKT